MRSQRRAVTVKDVPILPLPRFHLFSKHPNTSFQALHAAVRSETSAVSGSTNPNKDKLREREFFRAGALFALYLCSAQYRGHLFHGWACSILKKHKQ